MVSERNKTKIVLIDSGVDITKSDLSKYVKKSTGFRINCHGYIIEDDRMPYVYEHGTIISMIIRHLCKDVEIVSINIFEKELVTDGRIMLCALESALDYHPDIIHMSIGTTRWIYKPKLKAFVNKARQNNTLIVAAANNEGLKSYPAYLKYVVGVKGADLQDTNDYFYKDKFYYAPYGVKGICDANQLEFKDPCGSSMAAAYITGHLARAKSHFKATGNYDLLQYLECKSSIIEVEGNQ